MLSKAKDRTHLKPPSNRVSTVSNRRTRLRASKYILARSCWNVKPTVDWEDQRNFPYNPIVTHIILAVNTLATGRRVDRTRSQIGGVA